MRCTEGELAVIIDAYNHENIGKIVTILRPQTMRERLRIRHHEKVWIVRCASELKWNMWGKFHYEHVGPVPENQLQPIRNQKHFESEMNFPQPKVSCGTFLMQQADERSCKRRAELINPSKCEC